MSRKIEIEVNGKVYPCRQTMGAMLRFKHETGKEVTEIDGNSLSDLCTFLWCCVVSACKADGISFDMSLMDFADSLSAEDMAGWSSSIRADGIDSDETDSEKKSR